MEPHDTKGPGSREASSSLISRTTPPRPRKPVLRDVRSGMAARRRRVRSSCSRTNSSYSSA